MIETSLVRSSGALCPRCATNIPQMSALQTVPRSLPDGATSRLLLPGPNGLEATSAALVPFSGSSNALDALAFGTNTAIELDALNNQFDDLSRALEGFGKSEEVEMKETWTEVKAQASKGKGKGKGVNKKQKAIEAPKGNGVNKQQKAIEAPKGKRQQKKQEMAAAKGKKVEVMLEVMVKTEKKEKVESKVKEENKEEEVKVKEESEDEATEKKEEKPEEKVEEAKAEAAQDQGFEDPDIEMLDAPEIEADAGSPEEYVWDPMDLDEPPTPTTAKTPTSLAKK